MTQAFRQACLRRAILDEPGYEHLLQRTQAKVANKGGVERKAAGRRLELEAKTVESGLDKYDLKEVQSRVEV